MLYGPHPSFMVVYSWLIKKPFCKQAVPEIQSFFSLPRFTSQAVDVPAIRSNLRWICCFLALTVYSLHKVMVILNAIYKKSAALWWTTLPLKPYFINWFTSHSLYILSLWKVAFFIHCFISLLALICKWELFYLIKQPKTPI